MQVENDYDKEVYNGDLGVVSRIDMEQGELAIDFDGREVTYGFGELDELVLAYATTIHKSQGSEYPAVLRGHGPTRALRSRAERMATSITADAQFAPDSALEGTGFETLGPAEREAVPRRAKWVLRSFNPARRVPQCARAGSPIMRGIASPNFARSRDLAGSSV
jgi:hypothetical protein